MFWDFYATCYDTLLWMRPYRQLLDRLAQVSSLEPGQRVLDAGCGTANLTMILLTMEAGRQATIEMGDASPPMLRRARHKTERHSTVSAAPLNLAAHLPQDTGRYDRILCCNVLYALPDPLATLREFYRVPKPGGKLVLSTPREDASPAGLWRGHFRAMVSLGDWLSTAARLPLLGAVHLMNLVILRRRQAAVYHFMDQARLTQLLTEAGYSTVMLEPGYADQNWVVVAEPVLSATQPRVQARETAHVETC